MISEGGYKSILGFLTYTANAGSLVERLREQLRRLKASYPDRLFVLSIVGGRERVKEYESDGFTVFEDPARAVVAIAAMGRFGDAFARGPALAPPTVAPVVRPGGNPSEAEAKALLAKAGILSAPERVCRTPDEAVAAAAEFGFPVVLKIVSPDILHKTEIGGVLLDIGSEAAVREGGKLLLDRAGRLAPHAQIDGVLVAQQLVGGVECILGVHRDPVFGPVAMVGLGGIFVEILKDVAFRRCPFGVDVAEEMIRSLNGAPLLLGARGRPPADIGALADMLARLSAFAAAAGESLQSVDINPVIVLPQGQGAFAADAAIVIGGRHGDRL
jgi:acyl-CoA synthetase (NDP forming)